jgi:hypothetical protein
MLSARMSVLTPVGRHVGVPLGRLARSILVAFMAPSLFDDQAGGSRFGAIIRQQ